MGFDQGTLLTGKVLIITGVGPGMGQALAKLAAAEGAKVALAARNVAFLEVVAEEIRIAGGQAICVRTDVGDRAQCDALVERTVEAYGRIDALVNSAYAPGESGRFADANIEEWGQVLDVGCLGAVRMSQAVLPHMKGRGGSIVNVCSMQAQKPLVGASLSYAISKGALVVASRQMAAELGEFNIRVNALRMGWLWGTPVKNAVAGMAAASGRRESEVILEISQRIALRTIPPEEECAKTVLMFASDYTKMVTGAVLDVNGGDWMAP